MSLIITFNGQFKPYTATKITDNDRVKKLSLVAPTFNDLIYQYLEIETVEGKDFIDRDNQQKKKLLNPKVKSYTQKPNEFKKRFYAKDIMSTTLMSLGPDDTIDKALQLMGKKQIHHVPIVDEGGMKGIVSDKLLLKSLADQYSLQTPLKKIMKQKVLTALEHSSIQDVARAMLDEKISCLPVTDNKLNLKGILTTSDILSLLILSFPLEVYA